MPPASALPILVHLLYMSGRSRWSLGAPAVLLSLVSVLEGQNFTCVCLSLQLKEMCRRELDKSESEIKKNGSIIGEYKQVSLDR